jgi:hypothetical protein
MKAVFCDVKLCCSCKTRRFGGTYYFHHQGEKYQCAKNNFSTLARWLFSPSLWVRYIPPKLRFLQEPHPRRRHSLRSKNSLMFCPNFLIKESRLLRYLCSLWVSVAVNLRVSPWDNFRITEQIFLELGMCIITHEPISIAHFMYTNWSSNSVADSEGSCL